MNSLFSFKHSLLCCSYYVCFIIVCLIWLQKPHVITLIKDFDQQWISTKLDIKSLTQEDSKSNYRTQCILPGENITDKQCDTESFLICTGSQQTALSSAHLTLLKDCHVYLCIRTPKCGSSVVGRMFSQQGSKRGYDMLINKEKQPLTKELLEKKFSAVKPFVYAQHHVFHSYFRNPSSDNPVVTTVIREPIAQVVSWYSYKKYRTKADPLMEIPSELNQSLSECIKMYGVRDPCFEYGATGVRYMCGPEPMCSNINAPERISIAKRNMMRHFLVVGLAEDLPSYFEALETLLPQMFQHSFQAFKNMENEAKEKYSSYQKEVLDDQSREYIRQNMAVDIEFYEFTKARFYTLLKKVRDYRQIQSKVLATK